MKLLKKFAHKYGAKDALIYVLIYTLLLFQVIPFTTAMATPTGSEIVAGTASVTQSGNTTNVAVGSNRTIIKWNSLDTASSEILQFMKDSGGRFTVLNRVSGPATQFDGSLLANQGHIIIVNPSGIVFGHSAFVDAFKFTASTMNISNENFMNGIYQYHGCGNASITNYGQINAKDVALIGSSVFNAGTIRSSGGVVVMVAGNSVYLGEEGSNIIVEKLNTGFFAGDHKVTAGGNIEVAGGSILLAAGDILSQATITDAASFVAQANQNIDVTGDIDTAGDVQLFADYDHIDGGDFHSTAPIAATGNIEVRGNDVLFDETVDAGGDLTIVGRDCRPPEWQWGNVTAMKTLTAGGNIIISDTGEKEQWVNGHWEWHCGRCEWIPGYWETIYEPGTIFLHDDVTAGGNLMLCNNTETFNDTGNGVRLQAGRNVILAEDGIANSQRDNCTFLHGRNNLEIAALNGQITNDSSLFANPDAEPAMPGSALTTISVEGSTLLMEQAPSFDLDNFTFANQSNTDLSLVSHNGSVTAVETGTKPENAADQWNSIGATAQTDITLSGSGSITSSDSGTDPTKSLWAKTGNVSIQAGQDFIADKDIEAGQNVTISSAPTTIYLGGNVTAGQNVLLSDNANLNGSGNQSITAQNGTVVANGTLDKTTGGQMNVTAADGITLNGSASAVDSMYLNADTDGDGTGDMLAQSTLITTSGDIEISASDSTIKLQDNVSAGQHLILNNNTEVAANKNLHANQDVQLSGGKTITGLGNLEIDAGRNICFGGDVSAAGNLTVSANPENTGSNVCSWGKLSSGGDMLVEAGQDIFLGATPDSAISGGNMTLSAGEATGHATGELIAAGNLQATGNITLSSSDDTTYLGGNVTAGHDLTLNNNTEVIGFSDQALQASNQLTAFGYVRKTTPGDMYLTGNSENGAEKSVDLRYSGEGPGTSTSYGNLWILGRNDIQISGDVTTFGPSSFGIIRSEIPGEQASGGVAIISETGSIYTDGADGALNVSVTGSSDSKASDYRERGVFGFAPPISNGTFETRTIETPETPQGVAAIAIVSAEELKIGDGARLEARGTYYDGAEVDDRGAIGFLDFDAEIPEGTSRNQGVPFDLAIYTASRDGSVTIDCPVTITSAQTEQPVPSPRVIGFAPEYLVAKGTMVIDALDIVTLGEDFRQSLANGEVGDRLEVCSRITEWLDDAAGRLPFPKDLVLPKGYNYVMRGAGAENPEIGKGAPAWDLEYRLRQDAAPIQQDQLKSMGCPALMNWVAKELGIEKDQIQIYVEGALAMSGNVQPCEICAQLKNSALMLLDADGSQMKALASVINEFAGSMPPSEEQMAMIASAMNNPQEGSQYALAAQWLEALTNYVNILNKDLKLSMDESVALAQKYASPAENSGNVGLAAYIQAQLVTIGG